MWAFILFTIYGFMLKDVVSQGPILCSDPADVAFVIDSSRSILDEDFDVEIKFVKEIVRKFVVGKDNIQVAALTFSEDVAHHFSFNSIDNTEGVLEKIGEIGHDKGDATYTHSALEALRTNVFNPENGARSEVAKIAILLTDGASTNPYSTIPEAEKVKAEGIQIIAIGVGSKVKVSELNKIASPPSEKHVFLKSFEDLNDVGFQELIGMKACQIIKNVTTTTTTTMTTTTTTTTTTPKPTTTTTTPKPTTTTQAQQDEPEEECQGKHADVVFVLDSSSSIWNPDYITQLQFVSDVVSYFDIEHGKTQVAMIQFSDKPIVVFRLNNGMTQEELSSAIMSTEQMTGLTNTHLALELLMDDVMTKKNGARPGVAQICVLITDSRSRRPDLTKNQAQRMQDSGIYMFAIGVGSETDKVELEQMASKPTSDFAFEINGYKALSTLKDILAYRTCKVQSGKGRK